MIQIGKLGKLGKVDGPAASTGAPPLVTPAARPLGLPVPAPAVSPAVAFTSVIGARPRGRWSRRWPLLVAAVAAIAIVASIAVLVLGGGGKRAHKRRSLGPAPDRMQTDQLPTDPWARGSGSATDPTAGTLVPPTRAPDLNPDDQPPDDDDLDLGGVVGGVPGTGLGGGGTVPTLDSAAQFFGTAIDVTCQRLAACWGDANATTVCEQGRTMLRQQGSSVIDTLCPTLDRAAATLCLQQLATLPCPDQSATMNDLATMAYGLDPCIRACER